MANNEQYRWWIQLIADERRAYAKACRLAEEEEAEALAGVPPGRTSELAESAFFEWALIQEQIQAYKERACSNLETA